MSHHSRPVFVIGAPRSGTSILTWSLGQHSNIMPVEESDWLAKMSVNIATCYSIGVRRGDLSALSGMGVTAAEFHEALGDAISDLIVRRRHRHEALRALKADPEQTEHAFRIARSSSDPKLRWVDGTPEYSNFIYPLARVFPRARFIHILRDVRLVVRSLVRFDRAGGRRFTSQQAYEKWVKHVQACVEAEKAFGADSVIRIRHQDLLDNPEAVLRYCFDFLGEAFEEASLLPLSTKINSSQVSDDGDLPNQGEVDPTLVTDAEALSDDLLGVPCARYERDLGRLAALDRRFSDGRGHLERFFADHASSPPLSEAVQELVREAIPIGATALVISEGDGKLLKLDGRRGWHFPQAEDGSHPGYHPSSSEAAIKHLEELRTRGAEFLVVPASAVWWFDHYREFGTHVRRHYPEIASSDQTGVVFALTSAMRD